MGPKTSQTATDKRSKKAEASVPFRSEVAWTFTVLMSLFLVSYTFHCTWVTSEAYSSPSIVLSARGHDGSRIIFDDFREAYYWLSDISHGQSYGSGRQQYVEQHSHFSSRSSHGVQRR